MDTPDLPLIGELPGNELGADSGILPPDDGLPETKRDTRRLLIDMYEKEKEKAKQLETELGNSALQALKYAVDLSKVYREAKQSRQKVAEANTQLQRYAVDLRKTVISLKDANRELEEAYFDTIRRLVIAAEYKDIDTGNHIVRISRYSSCVAMKIGMPADDVQALSYASPMHDIGKIGIPDRILLKTEQLLAPEFDLMKMHTLIGSNILADSKARVLQWAQEIALCHHEKWNGEGYPQSIAGDKIPLHARIVSLVDTFDALSSKRPYKQPYEFDVCCDIIKSERGRHFDPRLVDAFFDCLDDIKKIREECGEESSPDGHPVFGKRNRDMETLAQLYR